MILGKRCEDRKYKQIKNPRKPVILEAAADFGSALIKLTGAARRRVELLYTTKINVIFVGLAAGTAEGKNYP